MEYNSKRLYEAFGKVAAARAAAQIGTGRSRPMSTKQGKRAGQINGSADRTTETTEVQGCSWREIYTELSCPQDAHNGGDDE